MNRIEQEVLTIISRWTDVDCKPSDLDKRLSTFGVDSLTTIEVLLALEETFDVGIDIEIKDFESITLRGLANLCLAAKITQDNNYVSTSI